MTSRRRNWKVKEKERKRECECLSGGRVKGDRGPLFTLCVETRVAAVGAQMRKIEPMHLLFFVKLEK